jgi:peptide/nickel transport system ATP-binding protein
VRRPRGEQAPEQVSEPLLAVRDLQTWFETPLGLLRAVDGVSFTLDEGRTLGVVGESGSGKTMLARSIMNLVFVRDAIRRGSVRFRGRELSGLSARQMKHLWGVELAMVFQDPMTSLNPTLTIGQQLTESLWYHLGLRRQALHERAVELLAAVGIPEPRRRVGNYPHELSGGMRQRATIAIALACEPRLLIADEPTTALDVTVQKQVLDLLQRQQRQRAMGMILITHNLAVVAGRTDETIVLYAGKVVERTATPMLFRQPRHPYTSGLLGSIPRLTDRPHTRLRALPGQPPQPIDLPAGCGFAPRCPNVQPRCLREQPPLTADRDGSEYACFYPIGTGDGAATRARHVTSDGKATDRSVRRDDGSLGRRS